MDTFTHFNAAGEAHMVDVGNKEITHRIAIAEGWIDMQPDTLALIHNGAHKKGDVLGIARVAGIMGAKRTADLIPLCHPLSLSKVELNFICQAESPAVQCRAQVETHGRTGVEMEALTAVHIALLTIYDMCKAVDKSMSMYGICLREKRGGRSGVFVRQE